MSQNVCVSVTNANGTSCRVVAARERTVREKILTALFGKKAKVLVISPYSSVHEITIKENGGKENDNQRGISFGSN